MRDRLARSFWTMGLVVCVTLGMCLVLAPRSAYAAPTYIVNRWLDSSTPCVGGIPLVAGHTYEFVSSVPAVFFMGSEAHYESANQLYKDTSGINTSWSVTVPWTTTYWAEWDAAVPAYQVLVFESPLRPVYRFYRASTGTHFYTADYDEMVRVRDTMKSTYSLDGIGYYVNTANAANSAPLYRFYNQRTGTHLYTADEGEKNNISANLSGTYSLDGVAYNVSQSSGLQVHRFYSPSKGVHFYSADPSEIANVRVNLAHIWSYEGPAYSVGQ